MRPKLSGNIIFVFSDPGGAKPCLALMEENNLSNAIAISDRQYPFYNDFNATVRIMNHDFKLFVDDFQPELIFTGTSYTSDIEKQFIQIAKDKNIPCYSFVDHWTSFVERFTDVTGKMTLPDEVWVIDQMAKRLAIDQCIDETKLVISGNPYHDWLRNWKPDMSKGEFLKQIGLQAVNKKILVYAPDPLSNVNGKDLYGFDELSSTLTLVELFETHITELRDWIVLVKAHPNQNRNKLNKIISGHSPFHLLSENVDTNTTIYYADVVIGFFSSFLVEASIMKKLVLRFFVEQVFNDPLAELKIGNTVNKDSIIKALLKIK